MVDVAPVSVSRRIPAKPQDIFAIIADPNRHLEIDGSGMLRGALDAVPVSAVGDVFAMKMHHQEMGDYEMNNTVVEYQPDRLITWEPARRDIEVEHWHYRWRYELVPEEGDATVVTESFDLSHSPEAARQATQDGTVWVEAITESLERLERLCAPEEAPQGR
jgi:Polyketide cyclase / dehydrase and lipid transport